MPSRADAVFVAAGRGRIVEVRGRPVRLRRDEAETCGPYRKGRKASCTKVCGSGRASAEGPAVLLLRNTLSGFTQPRGVSHGLLKTRPAPQAES